MKQILSIALLLIVGITVSAQEAENNWHQFRGPTGNGVSANATPPISWKPADAKWKTEIPGSGLSSPVVWNDKIIMLTSVKTDRVKEGAEAAPAQEETRPDQGRGGRGGRGGRRGRRQSPPPSNYHDFFVVCVSRDDGSELWKTKVNSEVPHESHHGTNSFASGSPVTDGSHIWASFSSFGVFCLDMDGKVVWDRQLGKMKTRNSFGEGASPAVHGDTLVVNWDHEGQSFIEAMNAKTGKTIWKKDRDEQTSWSTPVIVEHDGKVQVITNGAKRVRSYNLANGDVIWECGGQTGNPIPTPMVIDDMAVCMTGFRQNAAMGIPLSSEGDITDSEQVVWSRRDIGPYVPTGVLYKGTVYSTKGSDAILTAIDAKTGDTVIKATRLSGIRSLYSSMVAANDHIYVTGRNGMTLVLKHGDKLDIVASNDLGEEVDATPAIVDNQIFIRGHQNLYCFEKQ
ncbi:outer membrane protein assembly factor BamB family protein [Mariniblastus fucicola]|uniref:Outer membrane biogenesis protein BamB n=1 Tax=Mariniblastus fucicola TaxID=980251 RepID=A0A5B9PRX2_9BACT|nr:PQQ-binding-like beta-propeller repeat protein [Mariniblastus fucicola]QEG25003.1 outer membrane biogenesis protein BamB [Mariniblastus fucicola]